MSVCAFVYAWGPWVSVWMYMCWFVLCMHVLVCECMSVCVHLCVYEDLWVSVWVHVCVCVHCLCVHVCECVCICVYEDLWWVCARLCVYEDLCVWMLVGWWSREDKNEREEFIGFSGLRHLRFPSGLTTLLQDPMRIYKIWTNIQRYGSVAKTVLLTHLFHGNN